MQDALHRYDDVVSEVEGRWGIDRLVWLVGGDLRDRFEQQMDKLNASIMGQVAGLNVNEMLCDRAIETLADDDEPASKPEGMQEGTSMSDLW